MYDYILNGIGTGIGFWIGSLLVFLFLLVVSLIAIFVEAVLSRIFERKE